MNSLDAIIATTFLLAGFGMFLGVISGQEALANSVEGAVGAKGKALLCASLTDSAIANSVDYFEGKKDCYLENDTVVFENEGKEKVIGFFDLNVEEHYVPWRNIFD